MGNPLNQQVNFSHDFLVLPPMLSIPLGVRMKSCYRDSALLSEVSLTRNWGNKPQVSTQSETHPTKKLQRTHVDKHDVTAHLTLHSDVVFTVHIINSVFRYRGVLWYEI